MTPTAENEPRVLPPPPLPATPLPLDYAHRLPPRWPRLHKLWRGFINLGPVLPWPSVLTLFLLVAPFGASWWLSHRQQPWQLTKTYGVSQSNGPYPNLLYLPQRDAIASADGNGGLKIWNPFTGQTLLTTELPPAARPPNPPPGRKGDYWLLTASQDESKLLAESDLGTFIWDARTGKLIAELNQAYLGSEGANRPFVALGALSPDGSRLAVMNDQHELLLYDITSPRAKLLARQPLVGPTLKQTDTESVRYHIRFSPTGTHLIVLGNTFFWMGDAATLKQIDKAEPVYTSATDSDLAFLHGGERMLIIIRGFELRLYDLPSGKIIRRWPFPHDPSSIAVSHDEQGAFLGEHEQASLVLNLNDDDGRIHRLVPPAEWQFAQPVFFPDHRRVFVGQVWRNLPGIIDLETGRHVATLLPPPRAWVGLQTLISRDGRKLATMGRPRLCIYEQVGRESAWGAFANIEFWGLALAITLLAASLSRDALRTRRRWKRTTPIPRHRAILSAMLISAGAVGFICPFVWWAVEFQRWDAMIWWIDGGWIAWVFAFHLFAGLGLLTGSRAWTIVTALLLVADIVVAVALVKDCPKLALHPVRVFDRMWMLPAGPMMIINCTWALLAAVAIWMLMTSRQKRAVGAA